jgi:putative GTP pyrophosphokinase
MSANETFLTEESLYEWQKLTKLYEFAISEINTKLNILTEELSVFHREDPVEHIKTRIKKPRSIIAKLKKKGIEPTPENAMKNLTDIAGVRIICAFTSDIYRLFEMIKNQNDIKLLGFKDYIEKPKENGYQSLHMIISVPVFLSSGARDMSVEIQIRTIAMDFWASLEHKLRYKYNDSAPKHIEDELRECAYIINDLDSRMLRIKYEMEHYEDEEN